MLRRAPGSRKEPEALTADEGERQGTELGRPGGQAMLRLEDAYKDTGCSPVRVEALEGSQQSL